VSESKLEPVQQNSLIPLAALYPHSKNFRSHPPEQIKKLKASLERWGQVRSIVAQINADDSYTIVAGHGLVLAAQELVDTNIAHYARFGKLRVDVIPASWDSHAVSGYLVADNLLSTEAEDDDVILAQLLQEQQNAGFDLASMGSDEESLRQMLASLGDAYLDGEQEEIEDDFDAQVDEEQTRVQVGDVWQLGDRHRVICGDSTDPSVLHALMGGEKVSALITDPPYGINIVKNGTAGNFPGTNAPRLKAIPIAGDNKPFDPVHLLSLAPKIILWGGNHYAAELPSQSKWLIWDKKDGAFQESDLGDCELAWTNLNGAARLLHHTWQGMYRKGIGERTARVHPTQKPVDLMIWCCEQAGLEQEETVLDCYLGSGSTLIACERQGLRCYGAELEPKYINAAIQRWEAETGQHATLLHRTEEVVHV
jgi:hypothetical protein